MFPVNGAILFRIRVAHELGGFVDGKPVGRKRNSAEDIVRKLHRADELNAASKTQEEIAADLEVSAATLYNRRRQYGGMDTHPLRGFRRAWTHLRHYEGMRVNRRKFERLWKEECLQVRIYNPRKRAGISSCLSGRGEGAEVVWTSYFRFDLTVDGKAIKITSMIEEHTRQSLLNIVERSITAQRLTDEFDKTSALWDGPPMVLRMDNGPEFISHVLQQFCRDQVGISYLPPGTSWNNPHIESFNNRLRRECFNHKHWTRLLEAGVVIDDFKYDHNHRHRHSSLGYLTRRVSSTMHTQPAC